jgi:hypothetical protein
MMMTLDLLSLRYVVLTDEQCIQIINEFVQPELISQYPKIDFFYNLEHYNDGKVLHYFPKSSQNRINKIVGRVARENQATIVVNLDGRIWKGPPNFIHNFKLQEILAQELQNVREVKAMLRIKK